MPIPAHTASVPVLFRRHRALTSLSGLIDIPAQRLDIVASGVAEIDSLGGLVLRSAVDAHVSRSKRHEVVLREPRVQGIWDTMSDLLGPLPGTCSCNGDVAYGQIDRRVLVPVACIDRPEQLPELGEIAMVQATAELDLDPRAARLLGLATSVLVENQLEHAGATLAPPGVACTLQPIDNNIQLAALDLGTSVAGSSEPVEELRSLVASTRRHRRSLHTLMEVANRRDVDMTLRLAAGTGRARWRTGGRFSYSADANVPGFAASVEIHL